jgi:broad specificity phosphatase PhoE
MNSLGSVKPPISPGDSAQGKQPQEMRRNASAAHTKIPSNEAGSTKDDIVRGSIDVPLNAEGMKEAKKLGEDTANQFDRIVSSDMIRARQTAHEVSKTNPAAGAVMVTPDLQSWRMGGLEGRPLAEVENDIKDRITNNPDKAMPEAGEDSTHPGESFNQFKDRIIGFVQKEAKHYPEGTRILYQTHQRPLHLINAWLKNGASEDRSIDTEAMLKPANENPGSLEYLTSDGKLKSVTHAAEPGIYFARHGATALNSGAS